MTEPTPEAADAAEHRAQIEMLERRIARERKARLEAERIAEDGMRALYLANTELDSRILERTSQLDEALRSANTANRAKDAFLAHMSHHLMTPLNGVVGMLELLGDTDFNDHEADWHASALRSANRLDRLVRQLLTFVRVDGVDLRVDAPRQPLGLVLEGLEAQWHQPLLRAGQLPMFETTGWRDHWVAAPSELSLLFEELFSNVVEHAGPGPVTMAARTIDADTVAIDVGDPGPGIDAEVQRMAESLGVRDHPEQQGDGKAALGLVLMNRIADGLGGRIRFGEVSPSTVTLELPVEHDRR